MTRLFSLLLICVSCVPAFAADNDLEKALAAKYENTVLIFRHPLDSDFQRYSANGELLSSRKPGSWTLDGVIEVRKIHLEPNKLSIEGRRRVYVFDKVRKMVLPLQVKDRDKPKVKVEISLDSPLSAADQADIIIGRVFTSNEAELIDIAPPYWRPFLINQYGPPAANPASKTIGDTGSSSSLDTGSSSSLTEPKVTSEERHMDVVKLDPKNMKPPKAIYTPEPKYLDVARRLRVQGTVVFSAVIDESGRVQQVAIVRPVGLGLDDRAVEAIQKWKFEPAIREGRPVTVRMTLEVSFNLY